MPFRNRVNTTLFCDVNINYFNTKTENDVQKRKENGISHKK